MMSVTMSRCHHEYVVNYGHGVEWTKSRGEMKLSYMKEVEKGSAGCIK